MLRMQVFLGELCYVQGLVDRYDPVIAFLGNAAPTVRSRWDPLQARHVKVAMLFASMYGCSVPALPCHLNFVWSLKCSLTLTSLQTLLQIHTLSLLQTSHSVAHSQRTPASDCAGAAGD